MSLLPLTPINLVCFLSLFTLSFKNSWLPFQYLMTLFFISLLVKDLNSLDLGDKYWRPWSKPILPLNLLKELLPPTPLAFSKTLTENFLFNLLDIVAPDIPDPITA